MKVKIKHKNTKKREDRIFKKMKTKTTSFLAASSVKPRPGEWKNKKSVNPKKSSNLSKSDPQNKRKSQHEKIGIQISVLFLNQKPPNYFSLFSLQKNDRKLI